MSLALVAIVLAVLIVPRALRVWAARKEARARHHYQSADDIV
jgi:putative tricarboxylic transport membrane protein